MRRLLVLIALFAGGCSPTVDELHQEPVRWVAVVAVDWQTLSTCIKRQLIDRYVVTDLPEPAKNRTELLVYVSAPAFVTGSYELRGQGATTEVSWRRQKIVADLGGQQALFRSAVDTCASGSPNQPQ